MITKEQIEELAKKFSIDWYSVLREYMQIVFLSVLYGEKESQNVFFKGGTAIRLLLNSVRFSEDLDFTTRLLDEKKIANLIAKSVEKTCLMIPDVTFKRLKSIQGSYSGTLNYTSDEYKHPLNLHLDLSFREKPVASSESVLETLFPVSPYPIVMHLSWTEILAEKIRALMTRSKGRDLFDIWYLMSKGFEADIKLVNKKLELYGKKITKDEILEKIKSYDSERLRNDLNKYLPATQRKLTTHLKRMLIEKFV